MKYLHMTNLFGLGVEQLCADLCVQLDLSKKTEFQIRLIIGEDFKKYQEDSIKEEGKYR